MLLSFGCVPVLVVCMYKVSGDLFEKGQKCKSTFDYNRRELLKHDSRSSGEGKREI